LKKKKLAYKKGRPDPRKKSGIGPGTITGSGKGRTNIV